MPGTKRTATGVLGGFAGLVGLSVVAGILISATVTPAIALSGAAASNAITLFDKLPSSLEIDDLMLPTTIYAKDKGTGDYKVLTQFYDQNRSPVEYDEISPAMYDAILSSEDPRYYQHGGVDIIGTSRALLSNLRGGGETQGGSTISQQYVKNILVQRCEAQATTQEEKYDCWSQATTADGADGIERKLQEMRYAIALEQKYSKNEILLGYLNIANFGGTTYGVDAAAKYYFNVRAKDLNITQSAILAGIVQNPNTYRIDMTGGTVTNSEGEAVNGKEDGYSLTKKRQQYVVDRMLDDGKITQEQHDKIYASTIKPKITTPKTGCAAAKGAQYYCQYVRNVIENDPAFGDNDEERREVLRRGGLKVYTTLDWRVQKTSQESVSKWSPEKLDGTKYGSAAVSVEPTTGRILSIAQNTKFSETKTDNGYTSIVYAGDQEFGASNGFNAGSTFKLFTLIDWLEKGHSVNEVLNGTVHKIDRMKNSCSGDWVNQDGTIVKNFAAGGGYIGTPMRFTRDSLNSGYFAMAEQLDLCDIQKTATKMGVTRGNGDPVVMDTQFSVIGSNDVSPLSLAGAFGTVANKGVYCEPQAIDKVVNSDGDELGVPERKCSQVLEPEVAATAAYALAGVMNYGGTGSQGNPFDGTPMLGKTGTHEALQTWLVNSTTKVATAVWSGNADGKKDVFNPYYNGYQMSQIRYYITRDIASQTNSIYGGSAFGAPDPDLTRQVLTDLPNVVGMSIDDARRTLQSAGFSVTEGSAVDSSEAKGIVAEQSPGAGRVAGGTLVTIRPSNGQGISIPEVSGMSANDAANTIRGAGFGNVSLSDSCEGGTASGTRPGAGSVVNRNDSITVRVTCPEGEGEGDGNGNGDGDRDD